MTALAKTYLNLAESLPVSTGKLERSGRLSVDRETPCAPFVSGSFTLSVDLPIARISHFPFDGPPAPRNRAEWVMQKIDRWRQENQ